MSHHQNHDSHDGHHVVPFKIYYMVWIALIAGTVITVATSYMDFGSWNIYVAMAIATVKAMLVIFFFMGLKYDSAENIGTFFLSFFFLSVFVFFTAIDIFYRPFAEPVKVDLSELQMDAEPVNVSALVKPTPELLTKGKNIFAAQCLMCHGAEGKGDGPASASLNPKPRNFTGVDGWKSGRSLQKIFTTLTNGLNTMPSFGSLTIEERLSLAHYVRTFMGSSAPADTPAELDAIKGMAASQKPKLPMKLAIEKIAMDQDPGVSGHAMAVSYGAEARGVYGQYCMSCHGANARGGVQVQAVGVNPPLRFITAPLSAGSFDQFQKKVSEGIPGRGMPGFAHFSQTQWQELYQYVKNAR